MREWDEVVEELLTRTVKQREWRSQRPDDETIGGGGVRYGS